MLEIEIPGFGNLRLDHLVMDYNGTLACDGRLLDGVGARLAALSDRLQAHVLTADTFGEARSQLAGTSSTLTILPRDGQDLGKLEHVKALGPEATVAIGNGRNDRLMLDAAALGVVVLQAEGAATQTLMAGDLVCSTVLNALDLLLNPLRLVATLRS